MQIDSSKPLGVEASIYHYTSIQSLACILKSGNLRFTRLDQFDDVQEGQKIADWNFGAMLFASCWGIDSSEDYPQWEMYGDAMRGVRLSLPSDPFDWYSYYQEGAYVNQVYSPIPRELLRGEDFHVGPDLNDHANFLRQVEYVEDINHHWRNNCHVEGNSLVVKDGLQQVASYKSKRWAFQKEHRFLVQVLGPFNPATQQPAGPEMTWFDVPLGKHAFENLIIRMGPLSTAADRIIVDSLVRSFALEAKVEESHLIGLVRRRVR